MEIVNPVEAAELEGWTATLRSTFLRAPDPGEDRVGAQRWAARLTAERTWGAREHGRWVATLASDARRLTVPGHDGGTVDLGVDALTAVTVNPTHRRRGLLTRMLTDSLRAAKDRGDAISYLVAAEWPIYGRFGYAPATLHADYTYFTRARGAGIEAVAGTVRTASIAEVVDVGPQLFERARRHRPGEVDRLPPYWSTAFDDSKAETRHNLIVHESHGAVDGLLAWRPTRDFELGTGYGRVEVEDLVTASPAAYRNLWAYLSGIDVVDRVRITGRPVDEPARWLLGDGRALRQTYAGDFTWVCLLDVPAALCARGYDVDVSCVLDVVDESVHGFARGRFAFEAGRDGASCTPTDRPPDLTLSAGALASAYLGGYRLRSRLVAGDVREHTAGALNALDPALAATTVPHCSSGF